VSSQDKEQLLTDSIPVEKQGSGGSTLYATTTTAVGDLDIDIGKGLVGAHSHLPLGEAHNDFWGLPSNPVSIYHTGPAWPLPTGPQAQRIPKEARPVCDHAIAPVWHQLGKKIYEYFDSIALKWTSIDPVRFAEEKKEAGPLFIWVGVLPRSLSLDDARVAARSCKEILKEYEITDVEIGFRESIFTRFTGPQVLDHVLSVDVDPTADVRGPFTAALGFSIAPKAFSHLEGTGCLYLREGGQSNRLFLLTARHVAIPPREYSNDLYHRKNNSMPRRDILHLGNGGFQKALEAIIVKIEHDGHMVDRYKGQIEGLGEAVEGEDAIVTTSRKVLEAKLAEVEVSKARVTEFHDNITKLWSSESRRVLGHVVYAPPISVGSGNKQFTEDLALIELDRSRFNWNTFRGNVIHLGAFRSIYLIKIDLFNCYI
jgi:hypothetical protein